MEISQLLAPFDISAIEVKKLEGYGSLNYRIKTESGELFVLKHYLDPQEYDLVNAENTVLESLRSFSSVHIPKLFSNHKNKNLHQYPDGSFARLLSFVPGRFLAEVHFDNQLLDSFGKKMALFNIQMLSTVNHLIAARIQVWDLKMCLLNIQKLQFIKDASQRKIASYFFDQYKEFVNPIIPSLRHQLIHNDLNDWNVLVEDGLVSGFIDFGDIAYAPLINELAIALSYAMLNKDEPLAAAKRIITSYHKENPLTQQEISLLYYLIPARLATSVCNSAEAKKEKNDTQYILVSEKPAWALLSKWISLNPLFVTNEFLSSAGFKPIEVFEEKVVAQRQKHFSAAMSLSYNQPIYFRSATFQYMFDQSGNSFLDAYNNIPLVGHCHPKISEAISKQIRLLNTNTRYHYDALGEYTEQLLALFPNSLSKIFFVNSGSAASDLAIRLAENYNDKKHHLVIEHGYHGNTKGSIDLSSYKFNGKGGQGEKSFVTALPLPNAFMGKFDTSKEYLDDALSTIANLEAGQVEISSLIAESISGCGGQVPLIDGYLENLVPLLKEKNILYIADEVQTGFGRMGNCFWGFEMQNVVPDIVILGKPMGNGHPLAAVITTEDIADKFNNGMEFFSSFGGNPVSCVVGKTVLDIIKEENLQENARAIGTYWKESLNQLKDKYPSIGDVRGQGLFLGIELIDPQSQDPNGTLASAIKNRMREQFVLCGTDGPNNNVIKVKPPLCFNKSNVDEFIYKLDQILRK